MKTEKEVKIKKMALKEDELVIVKLSTICCN